MIDTHVEGANFPHDSVPLMLPDPLPTKQEEIIYLKRKGLFDDCWYCHQPNNDKPCGECRTCKEVAN